LKKNPRLGSFNANLDKLIDLSPKKAKEKLSIKKVTSSNNLRNSKIIELTLIPNNKSSAKPKEVKKNAH